MSREECQPRTDTIDCLCCEGCGEHIQGEGNNPNNTAYPCGTCNGWGYLYARQRPLAVKVPPPLPGYRGTLSVLIERYHLDNHGVASAPDDCLLCSAAAWRAPRGKRTTESYPRG